MYPAGVLSARSVVAALPCQSAVGVALFAGIPVSPHLSLGPGQHARIAIRFEEVSRVKKPSRKAPKEAREQYKEAIKQHNLSHSFVEMMGQLRAELDRAGGEKKVLVLAGDGSFCNRTCMRAPRDRTELISRTRKDAVLCWGATEGSRRFYGTEKFTPDQVRT